MSEYNKQIVRKNFENVWNQGDMTVADEICADSYTAHVANMPAAISGAEQFKQFVALFRAFSPSLHFTVEDQIAENDKVATRWTARAPNPNAAADPAAADIVVTGISIHQLANGKLTQAWDNWDAMTVFQALGHDVFDMLAWNP